MELLDELVPRDTRPADWQDVLRRTRRGRPRARIVVALAVTIGALAGAPALAVLLRADGGPALPAQADRSRVYILRAPGTQRIAVKVAPWRGHDGICFAAVIGRRGCAASGTALVGLNAGYTFDHSVVAGTAIKPGSGKREALELLPLRKLGVTFFFAKSRALRLLWRVELRDAAGNVVHTLTNRRQH
jgi:hypothetical protein